MKSRGRWFFYILINIIVSALVTGTILFYYNRNHQKDCSAGLLLGTSVPTSSASLNVAILGITGTGSLESEAVVIQNKGSAQLMLNGWMLKNDLGLSYTFPDLILYPGGTVQLHTTKGTNTAADLYWQQPAAVWSSGELVTLYDAQNAALAFYRIP